MSRDMLQPTSAELAGRDFEGAESAGVAGVIANSGPVCFDDVDPAILKAKTLLGQLEQTAKGHGYQSFSEMQRRLVKDREDLNSESRYQLLKKIAPTFHEAEGAARQALPGTDATGLLAIQDVVRSVSRLIRVLLLGYTVEEREELADRMKAERAAEVDSAMARTCAETNHQAALTRITAAAEASSMDRTVSGLLPSRGLP
jgi:hypothetical protein